MSYIWQYYLLIFVILFQGTLLSLDRRLGKIIFFALCFLELFFIAGFRAWHIGTDTPNYIQSFILSINYPELMKSHMETGYLLFNRFLGSISRNPQILLISTSCFFMWVWLRTFYKYSVSFFFSVLLFVILEFATTLSMIRQEIAVCIVLLSLPFIIKRQLLPFLIACCIAACFHTSAIIAIALYFIYPLPLKSKYFYAIVLASIGLFVFVSPILNQLVDIIGRYKEYASDRLLEEAKTASILKTMVQLLISVFCGISYKYFTPQLNAIQSPIRISFLLWCNVLAVCVQFVSIRVMGLDRVALYFSCFNFLSLPLFVRVYHPQIRLILMASLVVCFVLYRSIIFIYRPEWNAIFPFEFCF